MRKSPITCKQLSRLASEAMDRDLTLWERIGMKVHLWVCVQCQRYVKHLQFLRKAAEGAKTESMQDTTLSSERKEKIKNALGGK